MFHPDGFRPWIVNWDVPRHWRTVDLDASMAPFLSIEFRKRDLALKYFTTLTSLGTPHDVTLSRRLAQAHA